MLKVQDMCEIYLEEKKFREIELVPLIFNTYLANATKIHHRSPMHVNFTLIVIGIQNVFYKFTKGWNCFSEFIHFWGKATISFEDFSEKKKS